MNKSPRKSKPLWRQSLLVLVILAAIFTAVYKSMDNITVHNFITASDGLTAAFAYLVIGSWVGAISGGVFALLFGKKLVDPDFEKIQVGSRQMQILALITGAISAGSTLFLLWGNQFGDPSVMISLGNAVILYTLLFEVVKRRIDAKSVWFPAVLVMLGGMMAAFGGSLQITLIGFFFVLVVSNGLTAFSEIVEQKGTQISDGVNFFLWRFFWLAVTGTTLAFSVSAIRGHLPLLVSTILVGIHYIPWITLTMFFVFLGVGLKLVAKKKNAVSLVLVVLSLQIVLGFPITILGSWLVPGLFGVVPTSLTVWLVRLLGAGLIILGVYILRRKKVLE